MAPDISTCSSCDHRSVSSMCKFARCPRMYFWYKQLRLSKPSAVRDLAMRFGSAIHAGAPWTNRDNLDFDRADAEFQKEWLDGDDYEDKKRNTRVGRRILLELVGLHKGEFYPRVVEPEVKSFIRKGETGPHEVTFDIDVGLPSGKPITGRIDALGQGPTGGTVIEYKTASQMWGSFQRMWEISPQLETYVLAMDVSGFSDYRNTLLEGILVAAGKTDFTLVPGVVSDEQLDACLAWWKWSDARLAHCEETSPDSPDGWPMERSACTPYPQYGLQGFVCDYQPLCLAVDRWPGLLGLFEQAPLEEPTDVETETTAIIEQP